MEECLLKVEDLHTYFKTGAGVAKAVNGVSFRIGKGETLGLVGESGCGKSMTALSIMRLVPKPFGSIVRGHILFQGQDLTVLKDHEMRDVRGNTLSMIFQEPMTSLNPVFRVGAQIMEALRLHRTISRRDARLRAEELLEKVGISDASRRVDDYPHQMSGGMLQRVMIAMALACDPKLIIADEPTTALDVTIQAQILMLMNRLKDDFGSSILLITHDMGVVAQMAQWVAVMYAGQIVEYAEVLDLFSRPGHPYTQALLASIPDLGAPVPEDKLLNTIPGIVPSLLDLPKGCAFAGRCTRASDRCGGNPPPFVERNPSHWVKCWIHD